MFSRILSAFSKSRSESVVGKVALMMTVRDHIQSAPIVNVDSVVNVAITRGLNRVDKIPAISAIKAISTSHA